MSATTLTAAPVITTTTAPVLHSRHASFSAAPGRIAASASASATQSSSTTTLDPPANPAAPPAGNMIASSSQQSQPSSQQSFSMSQQSQSGLAASAYRLNNEAQVIYSAVYSGVDVYEMEINKVAVMRRRHDGWLNATQILKVAGVDKGKRTKILEREIQTGEHEKVQGGYGKYQGTWIQFDRGVEVCRQYGVEDLLRPLLDYDKNAGPGGAVVNTPTKEQAMAAQRKRLYTSSSQDARANGHGGAGGAGGAANSTFFKNISSTATTAISAMAKARMDSPGPRSRNGPTRAPSFSRQPSSMQGLDGGFGPNSQESFVSDYHMQPSSQGGAQQPQSQHNRQASADFGSSMVEPGMGGSSQMTMMDAPEPPRKRQRMTPANSFVYNTATAEDYANAFPGSPTEPNESFVYSQADGRNNAGLGPAHNDEPYGPLPPLPYEMSPDAEQKRGLLMKLFMDSPGDPDLVNHEILGSMTAAELDMPIDSQSHTALHWAATLARLPLLRALIASGASPYRVNAVGETALMRSCLVTNSMEYSTFPDLLELLGGTMELRDVKGRTVLHHIAVTSAVKGRNQASKYYLESLLEWVVRQGSNSLPSSQAAAANGGGVAAAAAAAAAAVAVNGGVNGASAPNSSQSQTQTQQAQQQPRMGIARFMTEIVNAQDYSGDTALNIAARIGNRSIISQLLEVGADPNIANRAGLRPMDFGIGGTGASGEGLGGDHAMNGDGMAGSAGVGGNGRSRESSDDIVNSITHLLGETSATFQADMKAKQNAVEAVLSALRTTSAQLAEAKRGAEALAVLVRKQQLARQRVANLSHARDDEQSRAAAAAANADNGPSSSAWETELGAVLEAVNDSQNSSSQGSSQQQQLLLPSAAVLRARITAVAGRRETTRKMVAALQGRSRDVEVKYRRVVALATGTPEGEVEAVVDNLLRAVESEKGDLELGRVRRFLGGVEGVVH